MKYFIALIILSLSLALFAQTIDQLEAMTYEELQQVNKKGLDRKAKSVYKKQFRTKKKEAKKIEKAKAKAAKNYNKGYEKLVIINDDFENITKYNVSSFGSGWAYPGLYSLRGFIYDDRIVHQLYVTKNYSKTSLGELAASLGGARDDYCGGWCFYKTAYLKGGIEIELVEIDQSFDVVNSSDTNYQEIFGLTLTPSIIQAINNGNNQVKVRGKNGHFVFEINSDYVKGAMDRLLVEYPSLMEEYGEKI